MRRGLLRSGAGLTLVFLLLGCVSKGRYDEDVTRLEDTNKRLTDRVENLTRSNTSLDAERVRLVDELEDLHQARTALERNVGELEQSQLMLTEYLRKREAEVAELSQVSSTYEALVDDLQSELTAGQIQIEQLRDGIRLNLPQDILFPSGSWRLQSSGEAVLGKVAERLRTIEHRIEVQGHTDNVAVGNLAKRFPSNWELAGARASQVVRLFERAGVDPRRMVAISFGEYAPVDDNATPEGRARNRRIDIRLIPVKGVASAEGG